MASRARATAGNSRADETAGRYRVVTASAAADVMNAGNQVCFSMTLNTGAISLDLANVVMSVTAEICIMTITTVPAITTIDCSITPTVSADYTGTVAGAMAVATIIIMLGAYNAAAMTIQAERRSGHTGCVIVKVVVKVGSMTTAAITASYNRYIITATRIFQGRRDCRMARHAVIIMHSLRIIGCMASHTHS